jgi:hypothetical protein
LGPFFRYATSPLQKKLKVEQHFLMLVFAILFALSCALSAIAETISSGKTLFVSCADESAPQLVCNTINKEDAPLFIIVKDNRYAAIYGDSPGTTII